MCGIAGIVSLNGAPVEDGAVAAMARALSHRGPDDGDVFCAEGVGLGHRRLSIFDLSKAGHQPMVSHDGRYVIVHNGEVYNWPEIRNQLAFTQWRSKTDTETILQAYAEHGVKCLQMFNGMFAFAIWDKQERSLFLARDRIGIKPLLYGQQNGRFYFGSEMKALLAAGFEKKPQDRAVYDYLRWGALDYGEDTFLADVYNLPQGSWMRVSRDGIVTESYWDIADIVLNAPTVSTADAIEGYKELLTSSIALRRRSDVPVSAFLSGGTDSSVVVSQLAQSDLEGLSAFTYEFDTGNAGEGEYAGEVATTLGIPHHQSVLRHEDVPSYFDKVLYHQESPMSSMRVLAVHRLYELCRRMGRTVILEGHGGDQVGGGFEYYWMAAVMDTAQHQGPVEAQRLAEAFMEHYGIPKDKRETHLIHSIGAISAQGAATQDGRMFVRPDLMNRDFLAHYNDRPLPHVRPFASHLLNAQYNDFHGGNLMRVLRYTDRSSMSVGCEARVPILDHRIVELSFRSEASARVNGTSQRYFMREAAKGLLPKKLLHASKRSVVDPQRMWLKQELKEWVSDIFHSQSFSEMGYFDVDAIRREYDTYCACEGVPPTGFHIFQYINIALWHEKVIRGDLLSCPPGNDVPLAQNCGT